MKKKSWIAAGIMLLVTLVCLVVLVAVPMQKEAKVRNYFVNHIYFLLVDTAKELETSEPAAPSTELLMQLAALDTKCADASTTSGVKCYFFEKSFTRLANDIQREAYQKSELEQMAADLRDMIQQLSDKTGIHPRRNVSYKELSNLLEAFLLKWVRSKYLAP